MVVSPEQFQLARRDIATLGAPAAKVRGTWTNLSLTSPWTGWAPGTWDVGSYLKDSNGFVHLRGLLASNGVPVGGVLVATLPVGFRPKQYHLLIGSVSASVVAHWYVQPDGGISLQGITGGTFLNTYYSWAGFTWPAEQ